MSSYQEFIDSKHFKSVDAGFAYSTQNSNLFDYQRSCVEWALARGRAALFLDTGLGKTNCELEWAFAVESHTQKPVIILAPLCVSKQIIREAEKFGYVVKPARSEDDIGVRGVYVTNYEILHNINCSVFSGVVLDESSILKGLNGKLRTQITECFSRTPYRLSASATPSPNDYMELGTQCEFLGIMSQTEMLATFFIHDGADTAKWRLKGHGQRKFFEWLASWAVIMRDPSIFGFEEKPKLPPLKIKQIVIDSGITDGLLPALAQSLSERQGARRNTIQDRCQAAADIANSTNKPVILWCALNDEGDLLESLIPFSVQVSGSNTPEQKEEMIMGFLSEKYRVIISKPKIMGFGLNFQHCSDMVFVGLSDSWEQYYQAVRRCWRFGQQNEVNVTVVTADIEGAVVENIKRKDEQSDRMMNEMAKIASSFFTDFTKSSKNMATYNPKKKAPLPKF